MSKKNPRQHLESLGLLLEDAFCITLEETLAESGANKQDLHDYLLKRNYPLSYGALTRYFNGTRIPDNIRFLEHFADFTALNDKQFNGLVKLWELKRSRKRNGK